MEISMNVCYTVNKWYWELIYINLKPFGIWLT